MPVWRRRKRGLFSVEEEERIVRAIRRAESRTSGEIRVHVESRCPGEPLAVARSWFSRLGMHRTAEHNGVLFYFAARHRKFAVVGGEGIHAHVGEAFWHSLRNRMAERFRAGDLVGGLEEAILAVGDELSVAFPRREDDENELPDEISHGEDRDGPHKAP